MKKNNKRTLILSLISILVCLTMLIGSTFAWFTDTASTAVNKIESGTLDIDLLHQNGEEWETAENKTLNFVQHNCTNGEMLWEPGCTYDLEPVKVVNKGNLALKYKIELTGIDGNADLLEVIDWTVKMGDTEIDLAEFEGVLYPNPTTAPGITIPADGSYESGEIVISGHMREEAGNEYQGKSVEGIGITVYATQYAWECDSNNNQYDAQAAYPVASPAALAEALEGMDEPGNKTVILNVTQDLNGIQGIKVADTNTLIMDLGGHTVTVLNTVGSPGTETLGMQLLQGSTVTLQNGTLKPASDSTTLRMLVQNYCNLTLRNMKLDASEFAACLYVLSNNCGNILITGDTDITAPTDQVAFDSCHFGSYPIPTVTFDENFTGTVTGKIELTGGNLVVKGGTFVGSELTLEAFKAYVPEGFVATEPTSGTIVVNPAP